MSIENDLELAKLYDSKYALNVFNPLPIAFTHGKGVWLYDPEGRKYMDMIGGIAVNSLGHGNRELVKAISSQAAKVIHTSNYYVIPQRSELAFKLCSHSFADKAFFCNSGAEANEAAIKLARGYFYYKGQPEKNEIITAKMSFHGRTMATIAATGQEKFRIPFAPNVPGFKYVDYNDYAALETMVDDKTCAVMLELIQGESGVHPADVTYVKQVKKLCVERGILLIIDEVQTGIGRTGRLFCYENYDIVPDIMTLAKGLAGGVPIGAMLCTDEAATGMKPGDHGSTFGGNPLACAAANCVLDQIISSDKNILSNVNNVSSFLFEKLNELAVKTGKIKQVRGKGLLIGIEFDDSIQSAGMKQLLMQNGFLVSSIGASTIRLAPPLIITQREAAMFVNALAKILKANRK
ncbi:MAG: aspartate aminotransferase family protein [Saccharofermentans sp.]|nr:aspartate aminotransferase family protein [Saccharofermentans sp.]